MCSHGAFIYILKAALWSVFFFPVINIYIDQLLFCLEWKKSFHYVYSQIKFGFFGILMDGARQSVMKPKSNRPLPSLKSVRRHADSTSFVLLCEDMEIWNQTFLYLFSFPFIFTSSTFPFIFSMLSSLSFLPFHSSPAVWHCLCISLQQLIRLHFAGIWYVKHHTSVQ